VLQAIELTKDNHRLVLNVAFNYGGRDEIIHAVREIVADGVLPDDVDESLIKRYLYTADCPDPDLIIRTSGELRVSNFLIWQGAYAEWYVTPTYWPDFGREELLEALRQYALAASAALNRECRQRRLCIPLASAKSGASSCRNLSTSPPLPPSRSTPLGLRLACGVIALGESGEGVG
jgi:hypothetical protein